MATPPPVRIKVTAKSPKEIEDELYASIPPIVTKSINAILLRNYNGKSLIINLGGIYDEVNKHEKVSHKLILTYGIKKAIEEFQTKGWEVTTSKCKSLNTPIYSFKPVI